MTPQQENKLREKINGLFPRGLKSAGRHVESAIITIVIQEIDQALSSRDAEIVICAAVRAKDGKVIRGHRHVHALRALHEIPGYEKEHCHGDGQGFVTSKNRYVTRKEGCEIQKAAGIESADQSNPYCGGELYSEDLY